MLFAYSTGFMLSFSLILAIGSQNAFVLRQGILRQHILPIVLFCSVADAILIITGVFGLPLLIADFVDQMRLVWGVHAIKVPQIESTEELIRETEIALMEQGLLKRGDEVVILGGNAPLRGASNLMKIEIIDGKYD